MTQADLDDMITHFALQAQRARDDGFESAALEFDHFINVLENIEAFFKVIERWSNAR